MENKIKKIDSLAKLDYTGYQKIIKSSWEDLIGAPEPIGFALVTGDALPWKNAKPQELVEQPLLYMGSTNKWKTELNGHSTMTLKDYSYGHCRVVPVGKAIHVYLVPEKGKLTDDKLLKPIKKILKKFKPKVFLEVVTDLSEVEGSNTIVVEGADNDTILKKLGSELQKHDLLTTKLKAAMAKASAQKKQKLQIQYQQVIRRLKHLVADWKADIVPSNATLIQDKQSQQWQKIYQTWQDYFDKRQAAKEGKGDADGERLEEERLYTKLLQDIEQFEANINKGDKLEPSIVTANLDNLKGHYQRWVTYIKDKNSHFQEEIKGAKNYLQTTLKQWKQLEPLLIDQQILNKKLESASANGDWEAFSQVMQDLGKNKAALNQIQ